MRTTHVIDERVESSSSFQAGAGPPIFAGILVILAGLGGFGAWAAFTPLSGAVIAPGVVAVESEHRTVQHLEGGIVAEIRVRNGDWVDQGEVMIRLDATRVGAKLAMIEDRLALALARRARLLAERDGAEWLQFPEILLDQRQNRELIEILAVETERFEARRDALAGEIDILTQRIAQLREQIRGLLAEDEAKARQEALIAEELNGLRALYEEGHATRTRILALERSAASLAGERARIVTEVARAENAIGEAKLQISQRLKAMREEVTSELQSVQGEIFDLTERRVAVLDELRRTEIRAPQAGVVMGMRVHTIGAVIGAGELILDIVPAGDLLMVEARVRPEDVDQVRRGQAATVRLSAFDVRTTPEVPGMVVDVSADRLLDEVTRESFYLIRVRLSDDQVERLLDHGLRLVPGMPAEVFVQTGERTALSYLVKPLADALMHAFRED